MSFLRFLRPLRWWTIAKQARLVWRLVIDRQVPIYLKALPVGSLLYLVLPDLLPGLPFDDITVIFTALTAFIRLVPDERVTYHRTRLGLSEQELVISNE